MDGFGKHLLLPTAVAGVAVAGYYFFQRNGYNIIGSTDPEPVSSETIEDDGLIDDKNSSTILYQRSETPVFTDQGGNGGTSVEKAQSEIYAVEQFKMKKACKLPINNQWQQSKSIPRAEENIVPSSPLVTDGEETLEEDGSTENGKVDEHYNKSMLKQPIYQPSSAIQTQPNLSPTAMQTLHGMENKFFNGLDKKAKLSNDQLSIIAQAFLENKTDKIQKSLFHILHELRRTGYFIPGNYKQQILQMLEIANVTLHQEILKHLDWFEETIKGIIEDDLNKTRKSFKNDIVLVYSEDDHGMAVQFCKDMEQNLPDLKIIPLAAMDGNMTELRSLENVFQESLYLFILVSKQLMKDEMKRYVGETGLIESLQSPEAKKRVVTIWLDRDAKKIEHCPCELRPLKGIDYFHRLEKKCQYSMKMIIESIKNTVIKGRKEINPKA